MTKLFPAPRSGRLTPIFQAALIRAYKVVGLVALSGILIGLVCFLAVNMFYLVNRSWVRPVILSPTHSSVLNAMATLSSESARRDELISEREQLVAELAGIQRVLQLNDEFGREFEAARRENSGRPATYESLLARRALGESIMEREKTAARRQVIERQVARLDTAIKRYDKLISDFQSSAYIVATEKRVTVAFVPYENLDEVEAGMPIYACRWGLIWCREAGVMGKPLNGEVTDTHPQSGTSLRGVMVEMQLDDAEAAEERALFVGKRPFWVL
jgi:hypothetical protein